MGRTLPTHSRYIQTLVLALLLCLPYTSLVLAHEAEDEHRHVEIEYPRVGFLALREGICREIYLQGDKVVSVEIIECPKEELQRYIDGWDSKWKN